MKASDKKLGMDRHISRRDFVYGASALSATAIASAVMSPVSALAEQVGAASGNYPPSLTGMRGNHPGSFEVAHQRAREGRRDWGPVKNLDDKVYDLVVVGAGISGLSAAYFYLKDHPKADILILDNHDDFGGHAKRNEFQVGDRTLIGYGGSQTLSEPSSFDKVVKGLLSDLGVELGRFDKAYDQDYFKRYGLRAGVHFNKEKWGVDRVVPYDLGFYKGYIPFLPSALTTQQAVANMPISEEAQRELVRLLETDTDQMPHIPVADKADYLYSISYREFLSRHLDIQNPEVFEVMQDMGMDMCVGIEAFNALVGLSYIGLPGWEAAGLPETEPDEAYIHHFPDGNASIARLMVRRLIPGAAAGNTMDDIVTTRFDYSKLDQPDSQVQLRLNSSVIKVQHAGELESAKQVELAYVNDGKAYRIRARACVLACNNAMIPYLCPELPEAQRQALANQVKPPILYTNVALRNWQAWKNMGIGAVVSPGSYHVASSLDFPVSLGGYEFARGPDEPIVVHMERFPYRPNSGLTAQEQFRLARHDLLSTSFETIERNVREQLVSMLGEGGFDPARDIAGITVNRWAHGYAYGYNPLFDTVYENDDDERYPHVIGRKPFGRIAIANSDSAASAMLQAAVEQAHRAVSELN